MGNTTDCQGQQNVNVVNHPTETVSDTDNQIMISSMENQNEIFSVEDDSCLVEDVIGYARFENEHDSEGELFLFC